MKKIFLSLLLIITITSLWAQHFTLAVIPDSQNYVSNYSEHKKNPFYPYSHSDLFKRQIKYITDNSVSNGGQIVFALHEGDIVNSKPTFPAEWKLADQIISQMDDVVPFMVTIGNHDFDHWVYHGKDKFRWLRGTKDFVKYMGCESKHFKNKDFYKFSYKGGTSAFGEFTVENQTFLILALEYEPDDACLSWAQYILDQNKETPVIILTHQYLNSGLENNDRTKGRLITQDLSERKNGNLPPAIFEKLIRPNPQIFMILSGHVFGKDGSAENFRIDYNVAGKPVYAIMANYQDRKDILSYKGKSKKCGDGWLRLLDFDLEAGTIHVKTYSTELDEYETDWNSDFVITFDRPWKELFPQNK